MQAHQLWGTEQRQVFDIVEIVFMLFESRWQNIFRTVSEVVVFIFENLHIKGLSEQCLKKSAIVLIRHPSSIVALCNQVIQGIKRHIPSAIAAV